MRKLFEKILKDKKINLIMILCLVFFSLLSIFPIGAINSSTSIENTSEYLANVAEKNTVSGKYAAMMIQPNDETDKKINNPYNEFHYLYGIFKEGVATYAGAVNSDKQSNIKLKELAEDTNYSFLNVDTGFGVKEYYIDDQGNMVYIQEFYPLELMFYSNHPVVPGAYSFLYISQSKAAMLLDLEGKEHTKENFEQLLKTMITLEFDGVEYKFYIDNIYYERNYFYEALHEVMGDFFLAGQRYPEGTKRQGLFFLRKYPYQNKFYIQYANSLYSQNDFEYKVLNYNFKDGFKIDEKKLEFSSSVGRDAASIVLLVLSIIILLSGLSLILLGSFEFTLKNSLLLSGSILVPYLLFWVLHLFTRSPLLFSNFATTAEIWCILGFVVACIVLYFIKKKPVSKRIDA